MSKEYYIILNCGDMINRGADSLAELVDMLKFEGIKYKDVALIWLKVEVYDYHWR
ncbi:hypothetical protein LCGC14_0788720 [marine sediment metagenome]|uniref:Uncharacterized protein n=1 Tax=marine sediment metagenome TaxID=412755 RepID=A0A0F9SD59_9ZZZZ